MKLEDVKFKVWDKKNKEMCTLVELDFKYGELEWANKYGGSVRDGFEDVKDEEYIILLPYTTYKDKHDEDIYEHDFLNVDGEIYLIKFWEGEFILINIPFDKPDEPTDINDFSNETNYDKYIRCCIEKQPDCYHTSLSGLIPWIYDEPHEFKIIGNYFENPELLKKESD